jgi:streptogramin lyase
VPLTSSQSHTVTLCEICDVDTPAESRCLECEENFCQPCATSHMKMKISRGHHFTSLSDPSVSSKLVSKIFCSRHEKEELKYYCKECEELICIDCNMTRHKNHSSDDVSEVAIRMRLALVTTLDTELDKNYLPLLQRQNVELEKYQQEVLSNSEHVVQQVNDRAEQFHNEVEDRRQHLMDNIRLLQSRESKEIEARSVDIEDHIQSFTSVTYSARRMVQVAGDVELIMKGQELQRRLDRLKTELPRPITAKLNMEFVPDMTYGSSVVAGHSVPALTDAVVKTFGDITTKRQPQSGKVELVSSFTCERHAYGIAPVAGNSAWVLCGWSSYIRLYDLHGNNTRTVDVGTRVEDLATDSDGNVYVACDLCKAIKIVGLKGDVRQVTSLSRVPRGIAMMGNKSELVACIPSSKSLVRLSTRSGDVLGKVGTDGEFGDPFRVTVNNNGDVCVVDRSAVKLGVTIINSTGRPRATYNGSPGFPLPKKFSPRGLCCDQDSNIIVADRDNSCLHMLAWTGEFIKIIVSKEDGLERPYSVAVDSAGRVWVGEENNTVKVFQYKQQ